jgi:hypothetical protein
LYLNGSPVEEIPDQDLDEFLIQFKGKEDIIKIEVWANDYEGNFDIASIGYI